MSSKTRLANKTIWALEDIIAASSAARRDWRQIFERAKRNGDKVLLIHLASLSNELAEIDSLAKDARHGKYQER